MGLLLDLDDNIARLNAWVLISLTVKDVLFSVWRALVNGDIKDLLLLDDFLTLACLALVLLVDNLALALAVIARSRALSVHARP